MLLKMLSGREKGILFFTIGVITFSLGFNFVIDPILKKNEILNKEIAQKRARLLKYSRLLKQKQSIQDKYDKFSSVFKMSGQEQDLLSELERTAKNANIKITDIRPGIQGLIELRVEANMEGLLKFIYDVENSLLLLKFKKIQLSAKPNTQSLEGSFSLLP